MKAGKYDITVEQGALFSLPLEFTADDVLVDLTGAQARLQARTSVSAKTKLFELTTENGGITLGGVAGTITLTMTAATTAALSFDRGVYDLEIAPVGGEPYRLLEGSVFLSREVTR